MPFTRSASRSPPWGFTQPARAVSRSPLPTHRGCRSPAGIFVRDWGCADGARGDALDASGSSRRRSTRVGTRGGAVLRAACSGELGAVSRCLLLSIRRCQSVSPWSSMAAAEASSLGVARPQFATEVTLPSEASCPSDAIFIKIGGKPSLTRKISPKGSLGKNGVAPPLTGSTAPCAPWR
jgi:hypothetical protein